MVNITGSSFTLGEKTISPALLLAPMAGLTHSAFRRLIADFGGYGALFTEMLSCRALLYEKVFESPFTKRRASEGPVIYQLRLTGDEDIVKIIEKLQLLNPFGLDINLGCPAPEIKKSGGGCTLFNNREVLSRVLDTMRKNWKGILTVKCRLGSDKKGWQEEFLDRLDIFKNAGIDAVTVHPRFTDEKLKRTARWEHFDWIKDHLSVPLIANGDIRTEKDALDILNRGKCAALMLGRITAVKPWIFKSFTEDYVHTEYEETWMRFFDYTCEDFKPEKAIGRIKEFSLYYSKNFFFGHEFFRKTQSSPDLPTIREHAKEFFSTNPELACI
jgi:tRNA-dihydrouridine synthase B